MSLNDNPVPKESIASVGLTEGVSKTFDPTKPPVPVETWQQRVDREAGEKQELLDMFARAERDTVFREEWKRNDPVQYEGAAALYWSPALIIARVKAKYK